MTTINQLTDITAQHSEIVKCVADGLLDPIAVKRALQDIIDARLPELTWSPPRLTNRPPSWWRSPEAQLTHARTIWPNTILPEPPEEFTPRTNSEVLLLHVPDSFDSLWGKVVAPEGYAKNRCEGVKADKRNLSLAPNKVEYMRPVWLAFDPERGKGEPPDSFWGQADTAAGEVFSALIQFPEWSLAWFNGASAPNLSGYQLKYGRSWSSVPYLHRWCYDSQLKLRGVWADYRHDLWSSPSVREC